MMSMSMSMPMPVPVPEHLNTLPLAPPEQLCRLFTLAEILSVTNNFDESLVIGQGGFGKVYKAVIDNGASEVAIKRLNSTSKQGDSEFQTEIEMLSKFRHSHIVSLIGYCSNFDEKILVYEYMVKGSLADHLYKSGECNSVSTLSWVQRLKICLGAARGLDYLHTGTGLQDSVIHRDVKSSNILLDKNYAAKVSDFGLSRISPVDQSCTHVSTRVKGTTGYMDPEYLLTLRLTMKSDVYSFGVVLFEVLCGRRAVDLRLEEEQWSLARWAQLCSERGTLYEIIDHNLKWEILPKSLAEFARIANQCLLYWSKKRPTMTQIVASLELALALQLGHIDFSTFEMEIFCSSEADNNLEKVDSTVVQEEAIKLESFDKDNKDMLQSRVKPMKRKALAKMLQSFMFSTVLKPLTIHKASAEEDLEVHLGQLKRFSLSELQIATDNFSNKNILGRGGFGKVYKGRLADGTLVAVKRQKEDRTQGGELQFQTEVGMFSMALHRNILRLQGFCMTPTERVLVYPYMANGSVASCLRDRPESQPPLNWQIRKQIAVGSARGLVYFHEHCNKKIIHRDVKAANILLDEEFEAVVCDFGLSKPMDYKDTDVTTAVRGTIGHIAPEYLSTAKCSEKTDVFGYGIMLLELITGQRAFDLARLANDEDVMLLDWVKGLLKEKKLETLVDADMRGNYIVEEVEQLMQVALLCTQGSPVERPMMSDVFRMLKGDGLAERWRQWQREEMFRQEFNNHHNPYTDDIISDDELSGPR